MGKDRGMGGTTAGFALGFGMDFADLYDREGLRRLDKAFLDRLGEHDSGLRDRLVAARAAPSAGPADEATLLLALAPHVEGFIGLLFGVSFDLDQISGEGDEFEPLFSCRRLFVRRVAAKAMSPSRAARQSGRALGLEMAALLGKGWDESVFARKVLEWMEDEEANAASLDAATRYAAWALHSPAGRRRHGTGHLFKTQDRQVFSRLLPVTVVSDAPVPVLGYPRRRQRRREGFSLTDPGGDTADLFDEISGCIQCHHQGKDSCSKGLIDQKTGRFAKSPLGVERAGCPLEERISEMIEVRSRGHSVASLAIAAIDNPMLAGTGHRICNDCMTGCIFSSGGLPPVDVPEIETRILKDVLGLPYGFEIYSLLTRWNPMNLDRPLPRAPSGRTVLVAGLGPAGYTLSHHLLNDGHAVVAIDGLKIEPLPFDLSGIDAGGRRSPFRPVRDVGELQEDLSDRVVAGFGGVAEYGITARWDKNFLKILRLLLERRAGFLMLGGVLLGGTLSLEDAFTMGFDHVALCLGAGGPTMIDIPNGLAKGVRQASDFLMALQLTGAARPNGVANLQMRLPVLVVGGGLTAIDACTEALAYYPVQVEKYLSRFEILTAEKGEDAVLAGLTPEEAEIAAEFIVHARALRERRREAGRRGRTPDISGLLASWGGATVVYRRRLADSPAYRNHQELDRAFEEGIRFVENVSPVAVEVDASGAATGLRVRSEGGTETVLPARTIIVAAGTGPNTLLSRNEPGIVLDGRYFQAVDEAGNPVAPERTAKPGRPHVLMRLKGDEGPRLSFLGDVHPSFSGRVVAAMAGARRGYPVITRAMERLGPPPSSPAVLFARMNADFRPFVRKVERLAPSITEVTVEAPAAARAFQPGQFFRLQNYEALALRDTGATLAMEGLALTGAEVDAKAGLVSLIVLETGGSSDLCAYLKPGEPVVLMGPTGDPSEIPSNKTVLLAGGGLGNAVLFSIGRALRRAGSRVLYFAGYKEASGRFRAAEIEAAADTVVWCVDRGESIAPGRPCDRSFTGTIVEAMRAYAENRLDGQPVPMDAIGRVVAIGSEGMMRAVATARHGALAPYLARGHEAVGAINAPMQCMMRGICAQCLQRHRDPLTGAETAVFTCVGQDQPLDLVDFESLGERLSQNAVHEKLTRQWIARALSRLFP